MNDDGSFGSAVYAGSVSHKRLVPFSHAFRYRVFSLYLDLGEVAQADRRLRLFSHNRWNLFSFHDRDHGPRDGRSLRGWIDTQLERAGIDLSGGPVRLLCFPRVLGLVFNPLSVWFCFHADGSLRAVLYEVSNTFGEWHGYLIPVEPGNDEPVLHQRAAKHFHVSPFLGMDAQYDFRLGAPSERLAMAIRLAGPAGCQMVARHTGRRLPLSDRTLARLLVTHPLMTLKVVAAIRWQALRLWLKGARFRRRPAPPAEEVSLVQAPMTYGTLTPE